MSVISQQGKAVQYTVRVTWGKQKLNLIINQLSDEAGVMKDVQHQQWY